MAANWLRLQYVKNETRYILTWDGTHLCSEWVVCFCGCVEMCFISTFYLWHLYEDLTINTKHILAILSDNWKHNPCLIMALIVKRGYIVLLCRTILNHTLQIPVIYYRMMTITMRDKPWYIYHLCFGFFANERRRIYRYKYIGFIYLYTLYISLGMLIHFGEELFVSGRIPLRSLRCVLGSKCTTMYHLAAVLLVVGIYLLSDPWGKYRIIYFFPLYTLCVKFKWYFLLSLINHRHLNGTNSWFFLSLKTMAVTRSEVTLDLRTYVHPGRACRFTYAVRWSVYRENPDMGWHSFTFRRWFDRTLPFAVRGG